MLFNPTTVSALSAITLLSHATSALAGHVPGHARAHARGLAARQETPGCVSQADINILRDETSAFGFWLNNWFKTSGTLSHENAIAQLQEEFGGYEEWMNTWIEAAVQPDTPKPTTLASSVPLTTGTKTNTALKNPTGVPYPTGGSQSGGPKPSGSASSLSVKPKPTGGVSSATKPVGTASKSFGTAPAATGTGSVTAPYTMNPTGVSAHSTVASPSASAGSSSSGSGGKFNADASDNVVVYYGQSAASKDVTLAQQCADQSVDIVVLSFLTTWYGPGGYPTVNFGAACTSSNSAQQAKGATGLLSCPDMATAIKTCQSNGKKVMLSLGGATGTSSLESDSKAQAFATQLYNLFGAGKGESTDIRPFGDAVIDGFDLDFEAKQTQSYEAFVKALRSANGKDSYISAAPQCPYPDASNPTDGLTLMDFVFIQFYNNPSCEITASGFDASLKQWSSALTANGSGPKMYVGAPGCDGQACAGSGYVAPDAMTSAIGKMKSAGYKNFGGIMLWDGPEAIKNSNYDAVMKKALA